MIFEIIYISKYALRRCNQANSFLKKFYNVDKISQFFIQFALNFEDKKIELILAKPFNISFALTY